MNTNENTPKSLMEAVKHFADLDVCHAYMVQIKWPNGVIACPKCGSDNIGLIASRSMFQCKAKECRKQFSAKVGTIFEDSPLGLDKWFVAVWCITNAKNGISSCELARAIDVTQKSAWHMLHRIRLAMTSGSFKKLTGTVEADESFIGGLFANMHKSNRQSKGRGTGSTGKAIVMGLLERGGEAKVKHVYKRTKSRLQREIKKHVEPGSEVMTDALMSYRGLEKRYVHQFIDHAEKYVEGNVHTNGLENFWSLLKRMINGTYVAIEPFHLQPYLDEQCWRFNQRKLNDSERFLKALGGVVGKKLTYVELTGNAVTPPAMETQMGTGQA
jgi:transposase-like protein